jgi:hypothetical protein
MTNHQKLEIVDNILKEYPYELFINFESMSTLDGAYGDKMLFKSERKAYDYAIECLDSFWPTHKVDVPKTDKLFDNALPDLPYFVNSFENYQRTGKVWCSKYQNDGEPIYYAYIRQVDQLQEILDRIAVLDEYHIPNTKLKIGYIGLKYESDLVRLLPDIGVYTAYKNTETEWKIYGNGYGLCRNDDKNYKFTNIDDMYVSLLSKLKKLKYDTIFVITHLDGVIDRVISV